MEQAEEEIQNNASVQNACQVNRFMGEWFGVGA